MTRPLLQSVLRRRRALAVLCLAFVLACVPGVFHNCASAAGVGGVAFAATADSGGEDAGRSHAASSKKDDAATDAEAPVEAEGESNLVDPTQRADNSFIYDTTVESLFSQPSLYEGKIVQVMGEAIGDIVVEDPLMSKNSWLTLTSTDSGNKATISVLLSSEQASQIDHLGRYGVTGTTLQVRGVYHQACQEHEGLPDVHANNVNIIARGVEHPDLFELQDFVPGFVAVALGLILMWVYYFIRERSR